MHTKQISQFISILLTVCMILSLLPASALAADTDGTPTDLNSETEAMWQTEADGAWDSGLFADAIENVYAGGTIRLLTDINLTKTMVLTKSMIITSDDPANPCAITSKMDQHDYLLKISGATGDDNTYTVAEVTLKDVIVDGGSQNGITASRALIAVGDNSNLSFKPGKLILTNGALVQNNNNTTANGAGGGICVIVGSVEMTGGSITGNKAEQGGGVAIVNAAYANSFTMSGGSISHNTATATASYGKGGGGLYQAAGTFTITGGSIQNNSAPSGGGVYLTSTAPSFQLQGGSITGNNANYGAGIFGNQCKLLELSGGSITGNTASGWGGGLLLAPQNTVTLSGTIVIRDNINASGEAGANLYLDGYMQNNTVYMPTVSLGTLTDEADIHLYSWLKPAEGESLLIANPAPEYMITEEDKARFAYEDEAYTLALENDQLVLRHRAKEPAGNITVTGGTFVSGVDNIESYEQTYYGTATEKTKVQIKADPAPAGKQFLYWTANGVIMNYDETYTFYFMSSETLHLAAVYGDAPEDPEAVIRMVNASTDTGKLRISFTSERNLQPGCTVVEHGILMASKELDDANFIAGTSGVKKAVSSTKTLNGTYKVNITVKSGMTLYARAYLVYKDAEGSQHTIYSDTISASMP